MTENPTVTSRVTMTRPRGAIRIEDHTATAVVGVTGPIAVEERPFTWPGLGAEDHVPMLLTFARWAIGRQLAEALRRPFDTTVASQTEDGWQTVFTWSGGGTLPITVTLSEFVSYAHADAAARKMVEAFIPTLVPDGGTVLRSSDRVGYASKNANPPPWIMQILNSAALYP
ncbi:hypothetical protein [Azospirillum sp. B506]|uniref:hypothetical protein n=1 Tax=Azospirillum sp. B506 TaxID=137721 RepID=UPI000344BAE5|nr:hypothetical protein [Azospirillum sp. B506]